LLASTVFARILLWYKIASTGELRLATSSSVVTEAEIIQEVVMSGAADFDADAARAILRLKFSESQNERMLELADKHNRGLLSADELQEMESFRRVGNLLALLQAKARLSLKGDQQP
jgi:hypothetical protein